MALPLRECGIRFVVPILAICLIGGAVAQAQEPPLRFGLMPARPAAALIASNTPLKRYLERELQRGVVLVSARDYAEFIHMMLAGDYDFVVVAPHFGLYACQEAHWEPLATLDAQVHGLVLVPTESPARTLQDLRGKTVSTPDALALVSILAELELRERAPPAGAAIRYVRAANHLSAMQMVLRGLADATVISSYLFHNRVGEGQQQLRILHEFGGSFGIAFVASPTLPPQVRDHLRTALLRFPRDPEAKLYAGDGPIPRMLPHDPAFDAALMPTLPILRERLRHLSRRP